MGTEEFKIEYAGEILGKRAGRRHDRIPEHERSDSDLEAHLLRLRRRYHPSASCMSNTGPSLQTRL